MMTPVQMQAIMTASRQMEHHIKSAGDLLVEMMRTLDIYRKLISVQEQADRDMEDITSQHFASDVSRETASLPLA